MSRRKHVFTRAELRRRLPKRADNLHRAIADLLDAALTPGAAWAFMQDGGAVIVRLGRAHFLRFHVHDGQPFEGAVAIGEQLEAAGGRVATIRDFSELTATLTVWGLARRPGVAA